MVPPLPWEEWVALLATELTALKCHRKQGDDMRIPWWDQGAGTFADDPACEADSTNTVMSGSS